MNKLSDPVHFSNLKKIAESPAHYLASIGDDSDSYAYRIGRLVHALVLGVQDGVKWVVYDGRRAGKEWEKFKAEHEAAGEDIFTKSEHALCVSMALAIRDHGEARELIETGESEVPVEWIHLPTGRRCKTRGIDVLNRKGCEASKGQKYTLELKTAVSSQPDRFARDANRLGYPAQGAWFKEAAASMSVDVDAHFVIAVEKKAPHVVTVFKVTPRNLHDGWLKCCAWMETLKVCEDSKSFPGYVQSIVDLDLWSPATDVDDDDDGSVVLEDGEEIAA